VVLQKKTQKTPKQAGEDAGLTQEELAAKLDTQKSAISRIENHAEEIKLSTTVLQIFWPDHYQ
jgi:ribosome-binding protein aMBF1 (putative translation factor)